VVLGLKSRTECGFFNVVMVMLGYALWCVMLVIMRLGRKRQAHSSLPRCTAHLSGKSGSG